MPLDSNGSTKNPKPENTSAKAKLLANSAAKKAIKNIFTAATKESEPELLTPEEIAKLKSLLKDEAKKAKLIEAIKFNSKFGTERQKLKRERFHKDFIEPEITAAIKTLKTLAKLKNAQQQDLKKSNQDFSELQLLVKELVTQVQNELTTKPRSPSKKTSI